MEVPENEFLLQLNDPYRNLYDKRQGNLDNQKAKEILSNYKKFKQINNLRINLVIPKVDQENNTKDLKFYSRFENGNLLKVVKVPVKQDLSFTGMVKPKYNDPNSKIKEVCLEYDLYLQPDTNTDTHMHWYHFQTISSGLPIGTRIRFNIRNLVRNKSLY